MSPRLSEHSSAPLGFPQNRADADKIASDIRIDCKMRGCSCTRLEVEFVEPPGGEGFANVKHDPSCRLARQ